MRALLVLAAALTFATPAFATKPCSPDSWFAKKNRSAAEWKSLASWVVVGTITAVEEKSEPYPDCFMKDRSKCARLDRSVVTVKVTKVEKGTTVTQGVELKLESGYCAPPAPLEVGATYRFYGRLPDSFLYFAPPR